MTARRAVVVWAVLVGAVLVGAIPSTAGDSAFSAVDAAIVFGTTCARCHEGECSGRRTFDLGAEATASHVGRHAGPLPDEAVRKLFALLTAMKADCAYPPFEVPVPADGLWSAAMLARLHIPSQTSVLVPLGSLEPGEHALELRVGGDPHVHAEVVTRHFDLLFDAPLDIDPQTRRARIVFESPERGTPFLRLRAQAPILLERLSLAGKPAGGAKRRGP